MQKHSMTTIFGTISACCFACALAPRVNNDWQLWFSIAGCVSLALLGCYSKDCPASCPGTDEHGHKRPLITVAIGPLLVIAAFLLTSIIFAGCTSPNPLYVPGQPGQAAYVVSPSLLVASNTVAGVAGPVGVATGTGPALGLLANGIFALFGALSVAWARHKSEVAAVLAAGVTQAGPAAVQAVMTSAADSAKFAAVASALNDALPSGQAPGGPSPSTPMKTS
jgi:hypothetical protein